MDKHERHEKIELYGRGFDMLVEVLKDIPREVWNFEPTTTEWNIHEVILHLADSESNAALRARMLIVEPGGTLMAYDQDRPSPSGGRSRDSNARALYFGVQGHLTAGQADGTMRPLRRPRQPRRVSWRSVRAWTWERSPAAC